MNSLPIHIVTGVAALIAVGLVGRLCYISEVYEPENMDTSCELLYVLPDLSPNAGNSYGTLYTLDGKRMTNHYSISIKEEENGELKTVEEKNPTRDSAEYIDNYTNHVYMATEEAYASVVGLPDGSQGLLSKASAILQANSDPSNRIHAIGDSIVSTIVSEPQKVAYAHIIEALQNVEASNDASASIAVVAADGAILVNAASNSHYVLEQTKVWRNHYKEPTNADRPRPVLGKDTDCYYDYGNGVPEFVGSSFKTITARVLQQNDALLSEEFSIYNEAFLDPSEYEVIPGADDLFNRMTVHNHDHDAANAAELYPLEGMKREISLAEALMCSSNTYFVLHCEELGWDIYQQQLEKLFGAYSTMSTGTHTLAGLDAEADLMMTCYGQRASLTTIRLAEMYNHAVSGKFYLPFSVAEVRTPDNQIIYHASPSEKEEYHMEIDVAADVVNHGLAETFRSYAGGDAAKYGIDETLFASGRLLAKSGTAIRREGENPTENSVMAMTVLNEDRTEVICSAVVAFNDIPEGSINEIERMKILLDVVKSLEVI